MRPNKLFIILFSALAFSACGSASDSNVDGDSAGQNSKDLQGECFNTKQIGQWTIDGTAPHNYRLYVQANCKIVDQQCDRSMTMRPLGGTNIGFDLVVDDPSNGGQDCLSIGTHACTLVVGLPNIMQIQCDDGVVRNYTRAI